MFGRREVVLALLLFALPSAAFTLTNLLPGYGGAFHASERETNLLVGSGVTIAGVLASLFGGPLCARLPLRRLYLGIGIVGACFTLALVLLPHSPAVFGVAVLGENAFQALGLTTSIAIILHTVGRGNAMAATESSVLNSATFLPFVYMPLINASAYASHGVRGALLSDALISIAVCAVLFAGLRVFVRREYSPQHHGRQQP